MAARDLNVPNPARCRIDHKHKHGVSTRCYSAGGCRCDPCRERRAQARGNSQKARNLILGKDILVPATPTIRRLQALAHAGFGAIQIGRETGLHARGINEIRSGKQAQVALSIDNAIRIYARKRAGETSTDPRAGFVKAVARQHGYVSFAAWDDIDDPRERPKGVLNA